MWLKRDSGQYWPSICTYLSSAATCVHYNAEERYVLVGLENGIITVILLLLAVDAFHDLQTTLYLVICLQEFNISDDFNRLTQIREVQAHQARVTSVYYDVTYSWIVSIGRDKVLQFYERVSGKSINSYISSAWCTALAYPSQR